MGGACPSRAPPTHVVEGLRAPPHPLVGGWYQDGGNWLHVEVRVVITDAIDDGLSGSGTMPAADVMVVHFDHRPHRQVQGRIQANGDIEWDNGKAWVKYEGAGQDHGGSASGSAPRLPISLGSTSESMSPRSRDSNARDCGVASSGPGASQPGSTSKAAPLGAASPSPGDSQPRITSRDAPAVLWVPQYEEPRQGHTGWASGSASDSPCRHAVSSVSGASQPGSTSNVAPLGAACPSPGDSQPRIST